jgi:calcineurin-like phosphoesterase family protein
MAKNMQTRFKDGSNIFFTSDTHFGHENIIKFCNRPFASLEEMDDALVNNWNGVVPEDGLVFHLGDFAWGNCEAWEKYRSRLNGRIILIRGNHDFKNGPQTDHDALKLFEHVSQQMHIEIEGRSVYLNHFPYLCYGGMHRPLDKVVYQLFGHVHSSSRNTTGKDYERLKYLLPSQYDVGVDGNDFKPVSWHEVDAIIKKQFEEVK